MTVVTMASDGTVMLDPWDRMPDETDPAWEAFRLYRDMPERSLSKVGATLGKSETLMSGWSSRHEWRERCNAWDREQDRLHRNTQLEAVRKMAEEHANVAALGISTMSSAFVELARRMTEDKNFLKGLTDAELVKVAAQAGGAIRALVDVERLARGLSTENIAVTIRDEPMEALLDDPDGLRLALAFEAHIADQARRPALGTDEPEGTGEDSERGDMEDSAASGLAELGTPAGGDGGDSPANHHDAAAPRKVGVDLQVLPGVVLGEIPGP